MRARTLLRRLTFASLRQQAQRRLRDAVFFKGLDSLDWYFGHVTFEQAMERCESATDRIIRHRPALYAAATERLHAVTGDRLPGKAHAHLVRASLLNMLRSGCELLHLDTVRAQQDTYYTVTGLSELAATREAHGSALVLMGVMGHWELAAIALAWQDIPVVILTRRIRNERLHWRFVDLRTQAGVETIALENANATRRLDAALQRHALCFMLVDHHAPADPVALPYIGQLGKTPSTAAALSLRHRLPIVMAMSQRTIEPGHRLTLTPLPPVTLPGHPQRDVPALAREITSVLIAHQHSNLAESIWWRSSTPSRKE